MHRPRNWPAYGKKPALFLAAALAIGGVVVPTPHAAHASVSFTDIADTTTIAPGHGTFTTFFDNPSVSGSNVAFEGNYKSFGSGVYTGSVGASGVAKVVDTTDKAPGHTSFSGFASASVSGSNIAFGGNWTNFDLGIYTGTVGTTGASKIVDTTDTAPGHGAFTSFSIPSLSGSNLAFDGIYGGGKGIYTGTVGTTGAAKIVDFGDTAPGQGAFTNLFIPSISGTNVAFNGVYTGGNGIYTGTVGATGAAKIVDNTDIAPGHGVFTGNFGNPSISGSNLAFRGAYSGGSGIYAGTVGATGVTKVVDTLDTAPGHGAFTDFSNRPSVSGSNVAFVGTYSAGSGLYVELGGAGGTLMPILNTGDTLFGSTVTNFTLGNFGYDNNTIAFQCTLSDSRIAIVTAVIPEPSILRLLGVGSASLLARRRRGAESKGREA